MMITFHNQPKLSEHEIDHTFNERRLALIPLIESYITSHAQFEGKDVGVTFAQRGISSLISIIDAANEKSVLKIPLNSKVAAGEAQFLNAWEQAGVKVPHIFEEGSMGGHSFIHMEFIDAPILSEAYSPEELAQNGLAKEMGRILRRMHATEAKGFGLVVEGNAQFDTFDAWITNEDIEKRISYTKEHNLLSDEHGSIELAQEILKEHVARGSTSSYCHDDFGSANIFATDPLTVFDPNPRFNNGYLDLGRGAVLLLAFGKSPDLMIEGYFENDSRDERVLHASILLNTYTKFPYWHKTNSKSRILNMQEYLTQNKSLLAE